MEGAGCPMRKLVHVFWVLAKAPSLPHTPTCAPSFLRGAASSDSEEEGASGALQPEKTKRRLRRMMRETGLEDSEEEEEESAGGLLLGVLSRLLVGLSPCRAAAVPAGAQCGDEV